MNVHCPRHGVQLAVHQTWWIGAQHPDFERRKAEGRLSSVVVSCSVCDEEEQAKVQLLLDRLRRGEITPHDPHPADVPCPSEGTS